MKIDSLREKHKYFFFNSRHKKRLGITYWGFNFTNLGFNTKFVSVFKSLCISNAPRLSALNGFNFRFTTGNRLFFIYLKTEVMYQRILGICFFKETIF